MAWLYLSHRNVVAKNPDEEICRKMAVLAKRLGARVQGDDGEFYGDDGEPVAQATRPADPARPSPRKPWWRFW